MEALVARLHEVRNLPAADLVGDAHSARRSLWEVAARGGGVPPQVVLEAFQLVLDALLLVSEVLKRGLRGGVGLRAVLELPGLDDELPLPVEERLKRSTSANSGSAFSRC